MSMAGRVVLITGGAGNLGFAIAERMLREGACVAVADTHDSAPPGRLDSLLHERGRARYLRLDVGDAASWQAAVSSVVAAFGKLDTLVNGAGLSGGLDPTSQSEEVWDRLMEVNAKGVFLGMNWVAPAIKAAGSGAIVNISSIAGLFAQRGTHIAYPASKAAVHLMTKAAALSLAPQIRVNSVHPGLFPAMSTSKFPPGVREAAAEKIPLEREGRPEEVAAAVLFLCSNEASYISGSSLVIDGGLTAGVG